tara:strand:+ start:204 stop:362 length:159 start_codon:yes stop_codon:yes gene_type:complete
LKKKQEKALLEVKAKRKAEEVVRLAEEAKREAEEAIVNITDQNEEDQLKLKE